MNNDLLSHALKYAKAGYKIHPCRKNKTPHLNDWPNLASSDPEKIKQWWSEFPDASIGCACGPGSGVWVVDIDLPDGPEVWQSIIDEYGQIGETLEQQTGSGGRQLFFSYNGQEIRNSAGKLGRNVDTRGNGGFVILPPSPHPSGGTYQWRVKKKPTKAPDWLYGLLKEEPEYNPTISHDKSCKYGQKALAGEIMNITSSGKGTRNDTLNKAAYSLGQLIAGGALSESDAERGLLGAAIAVGLTNKEAMATINSGFKKGKQQPRTAPENDDDKYYFGDIPEDTKHTKHTKQTVDDKATLSNTKQHKAGLSSTKQDKAGDNAFNLTALITEYVKNSIGSLTTADIDREFCLTTRKEKNNRSWALNKLINNNYIYRDKNINGKYYILNNSLDVVDLNAPAEESFPLSLPFNIHNKVIIPPHAVIILAGSSNAGKTAFILNTLWLNRKKQFGKLYLMSEMASGEYITRIKKFTHEWKAEWANITAASRSYDFQGAIKHNNQHGFTCVDYLEESQGEYFKIASNIRDIYDSLGDGVCMIAIQKQSKSEIGRGGEGTLEKSRLYMTLDYLATGDRSIICALKLSKVKNFVGVNLQGHEIHFKLSEGHKIEPLTDWMLSSRVDRDSYARKYENLIDTMTEKADPGDFWFSTVDGPSRRITKDQALKWQDKFQFIDVFKELRRLSNSKAFLQDKDYFFKISGILQKMNNEYIKQHGGE